MASPILSIETHTITLADGVASASVALSVGDVANCVPRISYRAQNTEVAHDSLIARPQFLTGPNRLEVVRVGTVGPLTVQAVVIEFNPDLVAVQSGSTTFTAVSDNVTISAVDLTKAWASVGYDISAGADNDEATVRAMLTTTTNLALLRDANGTTVNLNWWVAEDVSVDGVWDVQRVQALTTGGTQADATITSVALDRTLLFGTQSLSNFGNEPDEWGVCFMLNATTVRALRDVGAGNLVVDAFVVTFTVDAGVTVQRGSVVMGVGVETNTAAITALDDLLRSFAHAPMVPNGCSSDDGANANVAFGSIEILNSTTVEGNAADDGSIETVYWEVIEFEYLICGDGAAQFGGTGDLHFAQDGAGEAQLGGAGELHSAQDGEGEAQMGGAGELHSAQDGTGATGFGGAGELHSDQDGAGATQFGGDADPDENYSGDGSTGFGGAGELHSDQDGAGATAFGGAGELHSAQDGQGATAFGGDGDAHSALDGAGAVLFGGDANPDENYLGTGATAFGGDALLTTSQDGQGDAQFGGAGELTITLDGEGATDFGGDADTPQVSMDGEGATAFGGVANPDENYLGTGATAFGGDALLTTTQDGEGATGFGGAGELTITLDGEGATAFGGVADPDENYIGTGATQFGGNGTISFGAGPDAPLLELHRDDKTLKTRRRDATLELIRR